MRTNRPNWNQYFIGLAKHASTRSADPRTNVGAVAVDKHRHVIATGYNGLPHGMPDTPETWGVKDLWVIHAEENLIAHAAGAGGGLAGATVYTTHVPCLRCARMLVQCRVAAVCYEQDHTTGYTGQWVAAQWPLIWEAFHAARIDFFRVTPEGTQCPARFDFNSTETVEPPQRG